MKKEKKRRMKIVATTSLPAVDGQNADCWNAARSRQFLSSFKTLQRADVSERVPMIVSLVWIKKAKL